MDDVDKIIAQWHVARPDLDVTAMEVIGRFSRRARVHATEMEQTFASHGLNASSFDVLATLRRTPPPHALSPGELVSAMMITSGTMTNRLDRLEAAGLVERTADPNDARKNVVRLTDAGKEKIDAALVDHVATQHALLSLLSKEEVEALSAILRKLLAASSSHVP